MYEGFYELRKTPFSRGIPPSELFLPQELQEVLERLKYVSENQLFAVLTGDCGTGKTTILRALSEQLDPRHYKMLYVSDSHLTPTSFYKIVLEQLGVLPKWNRSEVKKQLHDQVSSQWMISKSSVLSMKAIF